MLLSPMDLIAFSMFALATSGSQSLVSYDLAISTLPLSSASAPSLNRAVFGSVSEPFIMTILLVAALPPRASTIERPCTSPTSSLSWETYASIGPCASRSYAMTGMPRPWPS